MNKSSIKIIKLARLKSLLFGLLITFTFAIVWAFSISGFIGMAGYAWSDTTGWFSMSCKTGGPTGNDICSTNNYGVSVSTSTGNLSGYAWSDNIGWISFNIVDVSGCPVAPSCAPKLTSTGLSGFAKALAGGTAESGGWDGYIDLSSVLRTSETVLSGYAWGSDVIGWLDMRGSATNGVTLINEPVFGTWSYSSSCPSACGTATSTQTATCSGGTCSGPAPTRTCNATAACVLPTGTINVSSNKSSSWTITGPATISGSGTSQSTPSQPMGTYTITWGGVNGYITPSSQSLTLVSDGDNISFNGNYRGAGALPDLTASAITPNTATVGTPVTLSSIITNDGGASTYGNSTELSITTYNDGTVVNPMGIAFDGVNMWTTQFSRNYVAKISPTGVMTKYVGPDATNLGYVGIAFDGTNMWTANYFYTSVTKISPTGVMTTYVGTSGNPRDIAFDGVNMWTANVNNSVTKISPTGVMTNYPTPGSNPHGIAFDGVNMWVTNTGNRSVTKVSPTGVMTNYVGTGVNPRNIAFDGTNMWTANMGDQSVTKISPTGAMTTYGGIAYAPDSIAFDGVNMWVAGITTRSLSKITPSGAVTNYDDLGYTYTFSAPSSGIAFDGANNIWVTGASSRVHKISAVNEFNSIIQISVGPDGSGNIGYLLPRALTASLAPGESTTISNSYTFAALSTYSFRACADKYSTAGIGTIIESNEANNCGPWTNITVTASTTGTWAYPSSCPSACGTATSTQTQTCVGGTCSGSAATRTCNATAACTCSAPLTQNATTSCDLDVNGNSAISGSVTRSQTKSDYPACTFPTPVTSSNSTYVSDTCVYPTTCSSPLAQNVTVSCDLDMDGNSAISGSVTRSQTKSDYPACTFPELPVTSDNSTYVSDNCVYPVCSSPIAQNVTVSCDLNMDGNSAISGSVTRSQIKSDYPACTFPELPVTSDNSMYVSDDCAYTTCTTGTTWNTTTGQCEDDAVTNISANPIKISYNGSSTITWGPTSNATACTEGGDTPIWSDSGVFSGSRSTGELTTPSPREYTYRCSNGLGADSPLMSATVTICDMYNPVLKSSICQPGPTVTNTLGNCNYTPNCSLAVTTGYSETCNLYKDDDFFSTVSPNSTEVFNLNQKGEYVTKCTIKSDDGMTFSGEDTAEYSLLPRPIVSLSASPRNIYINSRTVLNWTVTYPNSAQIPLKKACTLTAKPICNQGACNDGQILASTTINYVINNGYTDIDDPQGSRRIRSAVNEVAPPSSTDLQAHGKKTFTLNKSMDFILSCGKGVNESQTVRVLVISSTEG